MKRLLSQGGVEGLARRLFTRPRVYKGLHTSLFEFLAPTSAPLDAFAKSSCVPGRGYRVQTRKGYYAPSGG